MRKGCFFKESQLRLLCYGLLLVLLLVIWIPIPVIRHYYVADAVITDDMIHKARSVPDDSILDEIRRFFEPLENVDKKQLVASAEKILQRDITIPGYSSQKLSIPFNAADIDKGPVGWQLSLASLEVPNLLLRAYEVTGRDDFLMTAKDIIRGWALYEKNAWLPKGFLWNDHAVAARISVLAKFWKYYRNHKNYEEEIAKVIFQLVARSSKLLAKPSYFTFSTNHGVMQNLALLQICLAFPTLPGVEQYKQIAFNRLSDQMTFYINDEGVILEHSATYHKWGMEFIRMVFRYLTLLNIDIPDDWRGKYEKAKDFYAELRRPDGSLPMFGDTDNDKDPECLFTTGVDANVQSGVRNYKKICIPKHSNSLYPIAGYSIWWNGLDGWPDEQKLNQTVVTWSYFPGHAHKHADEMSVILWAGGQTWWTNVGYWPYGTKGREEAESWSGSNAPHMVDEYTVSARRTWLRAHGSSDHLAALDLERSVPGSYSARRQVVNIKPNLWIILDYTSNVAKGKTRTIWTTSHNISIEKGDLPSSFKLKGENNRLSLTTFIINSGNAEIKHYRGSMQPFAGWEVNDPASALMVEQPANNSWSAAIWALDDAVRPQMRFTAQPYMNYFRDPETWEIVLPLQRGLIGIMRQNDHVVVTRDGDSFGTKDLRLIETPETIGGFEKLHAAYETVERKYPRFRVSLPYRVRITQFLIFLFAVQEIFFYAHRKKTNGRDRIGLRVIILLGWVLMLGVLFIMVINLRT